MRSWRCHQSLPHRHLPPGITPRSPRSHVLTIAPKKNVRKMDLGSFLNDESVGGGLWADAEVDMSSIGVPVGGSSGAPVLRSTEFSEQYARRDREEIPIPDAPPYKARVGNLPYDATEQALTRFFEDRLQARDIVTEVKLPLDNMTGKPKGFAFVTFSERAALEEALNLTMSEFNGRKMYVNVAAPQKTDVFDLDWRLARGPPGGGRRDREREEVDLDWGAARSSGPVGGGGRDRGPRGPRREEPDLDWGAARGSGALPPREPRERRARPDEPELDWGSARNASGPLPPRERKPRRDEPELDWGAARGSGGPLPPRERLNRKPREDNLDWNRGATKKKDEKEFDWKRGQALEPRKKETPKKKEEAVAGPQKSLYDVLSVDDDEDDEETGLEQKVADVKLE